MSAHATEERTASPVAGSASLVHYEVLDGIARVSLDAPPLNILSAAVMLQLTSAVERALADHTLVGIVVDANGRAFSAGADIGEHRPEHAPEMIAAFSRLFEVLGASELPIVMAVDGAALGAGFELAMMADVLIASDRATFGQPEIRLGFFAPVGVTALPARVGIGRALEITCTGRTYTASEMHDMGFVSRVVAPADLTAAVDAVLADLRRASPLVMRMNVRMTRTLFGRSFENGRRTAEAVFLGELMATEDVREGLASFFEKRRPVWRNR
jgi:cyclohexa-1,5-dienecarbonyl-CoA hydratase